MTCPVIITQEDDWIVAEDGNTGIASQGRTVNDALDNLREALELFYEDVAPQDRIIRPVFLTTLEVMV